MRASESMDCIVLGATGETMSGQIEKLKNNEKKAKLAAGLLSFWERDLLTLGGKEYNTTESLNYFLNNGNDGNSPEYTLCEVPNTAVMYLTSFLRKKGVVCDFVNSYRHERSKLDKLLACRPLVVAVSTTFVVDWETLLEITRYIRKKQPNTRIVIGGPYIWTMCHLAKGTYQLLMKTIGADIYVFEGQGESALFEIILRLKENKEISGAYNLYVRNLLKDEYVYTGKKAEHNNLDKYATDWSNFVKQDIGETVAVRTSRGCPFKCAFCDYHARSPRLDLVSLETIEMELKQLWKKGVRYISFIDDTFNSSEKRLSEICRIMIKNEFDFEWNAFFRCSGIFKNATYDQMKESGCKAVFIGVESTDPNVLKNMNKKLTWEYVEDALAKFKERDIITSATLIFGFPGETEETALNTINTMRNSNFTLARAQAFLFMKGAPISKVSEKYGLRGDVFDWKHSTMDSSMANKLCNRFAVDSADKGPILSTSEMTSFDMGYFRAKGMSYGQILEYARLMHQIIKSKLLSSPSDYSTTPEYISAVGKLKQYAKSLSLRPSKFTSNFLEENHKNEDKIYLSKI